jgi:hypothetical protein
VITCYAREWKAGDYTCFSAEADADDGPEKDQTRQWSPTMRGQSQKKEGRWRQLPSDSSVLCLYRDHKKYIQKLVNVEEA